jgi:predicted transcriptional regulator
MTKMKLSEIVNILNAKLLVGEDQSDKEFTRCGASDLMSDILAGLSDDSVLLTGLTTVQTIRTAIVAGVRVVIFVRGKMPPDDVIAMARDEDIPMMSTPYSMFVSCGRLHANGMTGLSGVR